jgi:hypothetical protein
MYIHTYNTYNHIMTLPGDAEVFVVEEVGEHTRAEELGVERVGPLGLHKGGRRGGRVSWEGIDTERSLFLTWKEKAINIIYLAYT